MRLQYSIKASSPPSSPGGLAPRGPPRTGRKPLDLSGSCHPRRPAGVPPTPAGASRCRLARRRTAGGLPPSLPRDSPRVIATTGQSAPGRRRGTFGRAGPPRGPCPCASPTKVSSSAREPRTRVPPPAHRTPPGQSGGPCQAAPRAGRPPRFCCRLTGFDASPAVRLPSSRASPPDVVPPAF
jgi:hypothetical protein